MLKHADEINIDNAWKKELKGASSRSASRSWIIAALIAPFYLIFELGETREHFLRSLIFITAVSSLLVALTLIKKRVALPLFVTMYGVSILVTFCTAVMCVITNLDNVHYYLLIVSIISMSKGVLYLIDLMSLFKLTLFNHLLAYATIIFFRDEPFFEIPELFSTIFYQFILLIFSFSGASLRYRLTKENFIQSLRIDIAQKRGDELLHNILPVEIAEELKLKGKADAQLIDNVTVLFTDFKGFTAMSEVLSAKELVSDLNDCFSEFDHIVGKYGIEKIKTIGDAYMAAGGLPIPNDTHAHDVVRAAFEMRDFVEAGKAKKIAQGLPYFEVRIGVHTGPVVAGIVGVKKFQYDIWGDTVNTASRMESSGEVGKVNISQATYELLKGDTDFAFENRGKIEAKGKGEMDMYFVKTT